MGTERPYGGQRSELESAVSGDMTLLYGGVALDRLLADVDTLARGLVDGAVLRVTFDDPEALSALAALCAERGYSLAPSQSDTGREGDRMGFGLFGHTAYGRLFYDIRRA